MYTKYAEYERANRVTRVTRKTWNRRLNDWRTRTRFEQYLNQYPMVYFYIFSTNIFFYFTHTQLFTRGFKSFGYFSTVMAKIDDTRYPRITAEDAGRIAGTLVNEFGGTVSSEEAFAQSIGHTSTNSGAYMSKIADCRQYGIIPSRGLKATDLAKRIANPESDEAERETLLEMYQNIQLLSDLYENLNGKELPEEGWRIISEVTGANPKESREAEDTVRELYQRMLRYAPEGNNRTGAAPGGIKQETTTTESNSAGILVKIDGDELKLEETNATNIKLAMNFLNAKLEDEGQEREREQKTLS